MLTVIVCLTIGITGAYSLSRYRFRGRGQILLGYLVIRMFPAVLLLLPIFIALRTLRLYDTHVGLAFAYTAFLAPVCIWMLKGFFDAIPPELEDAARIDGCTRAGAIIRVVLAADPTGRRRHGRAGRHLGLERIPVRADADHQSGHPHLAGRSAVDGRRISVARGGCSPPAGSSASLPILLFFALVQRALVRGLTLGAVKG